MTSHPAYANSTIVKTSATASRLILTSSTYLANAMSTGAQSFTAKTKPNPKPMTFSPTTHGNLRRMHHVTSTAASVSAKTLGQVQRYAQNFGAKMAGKAEKGPSGFDKDGKPIANYKPGLLNKSLMAFSTLAESLDQAGKTLLVSGSAAATSVVGHRYGADAGAATDELVSGIKNVGIVYIDVTGVTHKALMKSVAKGMVVGKMANGDSVIVGGADGGLVTKEELVQSSKKA